MIFDDRPDFAKRLERARIARGYQSAKEAARRFGWVYETYIQHEQGIRGISRAAGRYAKAFKVSEGWLLTGEGTGVSSDDAEDFSEFLRLLPHASHEARVAALTTLRLGQNREESQEPPSSPSDLTPTKQK